MPTTHPNFLESWEEEAAAARARWDALIGAMRVDAEIDAARERARLYDDFDEDHEPPKAIQP